MQDYSRDRAENLKNKTMTSLNESVVLIYFLPGVIRHQHREYTIFIVLTFP